MLIGLNVLKIGKVLLEDISLSAIILLLGLARNKIVSLYLQLRPKYIVAGSSCTQLLWMKQMLFEYNISQEIMIMYCYNKSAINISKNPVQHRRTEHIDIQHHFIRELVETKKISL